MRRLLPLLLLFGCRLSDPLSPLEKRELKVARQTWERNGSANYTVDSRLSCFCPPHLNYWTRVTVRSGVVVAADPISPPSPDSPSILQGWSTVDQLFDQIERRADGDDSYIKDVSVKYDKTLGYPLEYKVQCTSNVSDCGSTYEMRNLVLN